MIEVAVHESTGEVVQYGRGLGAREGERVVTRPSSDLAALRGPGTKFVREDGTLDVIEPDPPPPIIPPFNYKLARLARRLRALEG